MQKKMQKCRLGERIKSHQIGVQKRLVCSESNPIRLVCRRKWGENQKSHQVGVQKIMQKCRLGERIKSHQIGMQKNIIPSDWCAEENAISNPIRLVCRRKCRLEERIKSCQVGVQKKMQKCRLGENI